MARKSTEAKAPTETIATTPDIEPAMTPTGDDTPPPAHAPDPRSMQSVSLSVHRGGPAMHLLRSQKFNQMQIRFDHEQPDESHLAMLARAGWKDRTEAEGVWTKQIDKNARWQSVQQMEREFKEVANAIRKDKGMKPVLEELAVA
jgi:hypothetical protein